jgi:MFS transporter, ENTS family, enterobactin (siderophore) exporter
MPDSDGSGAIVMRSPAEAYAADTSLTEAELPAAIVAAAEALAAPRQPGAGLWQNREFRIVLLGQAISALGDAITLTVLPLLVVALTGSGIAMGIVGVLQLLPDLLLGLPAGALADRWDRRRMIIVADLGRALLTALIPLSVMLGWPTMSVILLVTFPINTLRVLFLAAWTAVMPSIVGRDQVGRASGFAEAIFSGSYIIGPAIAGLLVTVLGPGPTLALDAASFLVSAASLALIRRPLRADRSGVESHLLADIREGVAYVARQPVLRVIVSFWTIVSVATTPIVPVTIFYLTIDRAQGPGTVGLVLSAYGLGSLVGALAATRFSRGRLGRVMLVANVGSAVLLVGFAASSQPVIQAAFAIVAGIAGALVFVPYLTLRSTIPPDRLMGRVGSSARTISVGLAPIGTLLAGLSLDAVGGQVTLLVIAVVLAVASAGFSFSPVLRAAVAGRGIAGVDAATMVN